MALDLSVIIPTFNGAVFLPACLNSLVKQKANFQWEIFIVDDGSTDDTPCIAAAFEQNHPYLIKYIHVDHKGLPSAKNAGIIESQCEILLFLDNDILMPEGLLQEIYDNMKLDQADIIGILDLPLPNDGYIAQSIRYIENFSRLKLYKDAMAIKGAASAYRRICFLKSGMFDEERVYYQAEDTEFNVRCKRNGFTIKLADHLRIYHKADSVKGFVRKSFLSLRNMDVPGGFFYYRCHYCLAFFTFLIVLVAFALIKPVYDLWIIIFTGMAAVLLSVYISLLTTNKVVFSPGILWGGILRVFFIFYGGLKYMVTDLINRSSLVIIRKSYRRI